MSNRMLSRACAGGSRALGTQRFLPRAGVPQESLAQVLSEELDVDSTTTVIDPVFATLLTLPITTSGGDLLIWFTGSGRATAAVTPEFRCLVDGGLIASTSAILISVAFTNSFALSLHVDSLAAGAHTVTIEWAKAPGAGAGIVLQIFPVTRPNTDHASLVVAELL